MSYYYNYYLGYIDGDKIYPFGPYNSFGTLCPIIHRTMNFASYLHTKFSKVQESSISEELRNSFERKNWKGEKFVDVSYLSLEELPVGNYIKSGYFLIDEVKKFEEEDDEFFEFSEILSSHFYAAKLQNEMTFGSNSNDEKSASHYMFYTYPDYKSEEFEARMIYSAAESLLAYEKSIKRENLVVLEFEEYD